MPGTATISWITGASSGPIDPLTIVTSVTPFFFLSADLGITVATGVSNWIDQTGNGHTATQGTAVSQPSLVTADVDFGGRNSLLADGSNDFLDVSWDPPAPATQPIWFFFIFRQIAWASTDFLFAGATGSSTLSVFQTGTTPALVMANTNTKSSNIGAAISSSVRGSVYFSGSSSDYMKMGSSLVPAITTAGNFDAALFRLFSRNGSTQSINAKLACIGAWAGEPSAGEKTALDVWATNYYGSGIGI